MRLYIISLSKKMSTYLVIISKIESTSDDKTSYDRVALSRFIFDINFLMRYIIPTYLPTYLSLSTYSNIILLIDFVTLHIILPFYQMCSNRDHIMNIA